MHHIVYRVVPSTTRPGKTDKLPVSWISGATVSAHDPAMWTDYATAQAAAARLGPNHGVGLVLVAGEGRWFLDIDNALVDGQWSPLATSLCQALAGAYVEVSLSGRGLHLIGRGTLPPHGTRNSALGLELYSGGRFAALTGYHASGGMDADLTAAVGTVAALYFPPTAAVTADPADWTYAPREAWRGPTNDNELIERLCNARPSAAAAFGGRATFKDLWEADEDALARAYPDSGDRAYDASQADAALAQHLAWATGCDCERIERLMLASGLSRDKYEREDYVRRTILRACALQTTVMGERDGAPSPPPVATPLAPAAPGTAAPGGPLLLTSDLPAYFSGCVYLEDRYSAAVPDGSILTPPQFRVAGRYGGRKFMLDDSKSTRNAWEAFTESSGWSPPFAHGMCFRPELPPRSLIVDSGRVLFNSYVPIETPSAPGDAGPFLRHLAKLFPVEGDRALLLAYMASAVQNPGVKFQWWPLVQGTEGNGKTFLAEVMVAAIGEAYCHSPSAQDISNKFNAWIERILWVTVEEIFVQERRDVLDTLKILVTNRRIEIQGKGANQVTGDNRANGMLMTNHKDAMPKTASDRRYAPLFCAQQEAADLVRDGMDGSYFPDLYRWFRCGGSAITTGFLRSYAIPAALDPAGAAHRAPMTSSTADAIEASLGPVEQAVLEALGAEETGFRGGWISSKYFSDLLDHRHLRSRCPPRTWNDVLRALGYVRHPALPGGRLNQVVMPDGIKPRLWVRAGSIPALNLTTPAAVAHAYCTANGSPGMGAGVAA